LLSSNEISRQLPSKPHVFKHDWIDDDIVFCCKSSVWWLTFTGKEGDGMFRCLCKKKKHIKTGKNVKYATAPGTRYRKATISEHGNSEEHKQAVRLEREKRNLDCVKVIFILRGTALTLAQPTWCISSNCNLSFAEHPTLTRCFTGLKRSLTCCTRENPDAGLEIRRLHIQVLL